MEARSAVIEIGARRLEGTFTSTHNVRKSVLNTDGQKHKAFPTDAVIPPEAQARDTDFTSNLLSLAPASDTSPSSIHVLEEFQVSVERASHRDCVPSVQRELEGLISGGIFKLVDNYNLPVSANLLGVSII